MPEPIRPEYKAYTPSGVVDSIDGNTAKAGGMISLANLIPDPETAGFVKCRAAAYSLTSFAGFASPGYVSLESNVGNLVVGFIATARNAGKDEPFVFNRATGAFLTISGITSTNVPTSPATSGAWTPPTVAPIGNNFVFTHPGFTGSNGYFGVLDMSGFSTAKTADTHTSTLLDNFGGAFNPLTGGVTVGMTVTGANVQAGTVVNAVTATTVTISLPTTSSINTAITFAGGTMTAPLWISGNTNQNPLPNVPLAVASFTDRAYFACINSLYYTDVLAPLNMANATNFLTLGGSDAITGLIGQGFFTTQSGGIIASLLAFKTAEIHQITGDLATQNLIFNKLSDGVGTDSPRSLANTPKGTMFRAPDGIRAIGLDGQVSEPNADLKTPFLNPTTPSRISAAYNMGFYRICTNYLKGGVLQNVEFWFNTPHDEWFGPHSITYDCITGGDSTFFISGTRYNGAIYQSNVIPNPTTDFYTELGSNLTWVYQTVLVPELGPMQGWALFESSIFLGYQLQQLITALVLDASYNELGDLSFVTQFLAPANATNWQLNFTDETTGSGTVLIPTRHQFQLSGTSSNGLGLGTLFAHYQYQADNNAQEIVDYDGGDLDFGSVTDDVLTGILDWGSVADTVLATIDFEATGTHTGPP